MYYTLGAENSIKRFIGDIVTKIANVNIHVVFRWDGS